MAKLSLYEVNQAQLEQIPKIDGQLIVISDTGSIYRDIVVNGVVNRILIGNDIIAVDELPLAPISNKIYYLKPNKLYTYNSGWVDLTSGSDVIQVQSDYSQNDPAEPDYIKNRPFSEIKAFDDIVWDGNTDGLTMASVDVEIQSGVTATYKAYKVSDQIISKSDIIGATVTILRDGSLVERFITDGYVIDGSENGSFFDNYPSVYVVAKDNDVIDMSALVPNLSVTFPEAGIWFAVPEIGGAEYYRTTSLVARTDISKIDSKYLPIGEANGVAGLDSNGKIPQNQINTVNGVSQYNYNPITSDAVYTALDNRDRLRFDTTPMSGSQNPVTSDGVYWAIENKNVTVDSSVQSGSNNPVSGNAVYNALGGRAQLNFDSVPTSGSNKLMMSGGIYTAIQNNKITVDSTVQSSSDNAVSGKAVYNALSNYYTKTEVDNLLGDDYYTKTEVDNLLGNIDTILDEINALIGE